MARQRNDFTSMTIATLFGVLNGDRQLVESIEGGASLAGNNCKSKIGEYATSAG